MPRFTLSQMFMGVAALAFVFALLQAEGCGEAYSRIRALSFSPDGKRLAVVKFNWRDANVSMKAYAADITRTISLVDVERETATRVIDRHFLAGDHGPAFAILRQCPDSLAFGADGNALFFIDIDADKIQRCDLDSERTTTFFDAGGQSAFEHFALSHDRTILALAGFGGVSLLSAEEAKPIVRDPSLFEISLSRPGIGLSSDHHWLAIFEGAKVRLYDATAKLRAGATFRCSSAFAFGPRADQLAVAGGDSLSLYDLATNQARSLPFAEEIYHVRFLDEDKLIVATGDRVIVLNGATGEPATSPTYHGWTTAIACSPDGHTVALGNQGNVVLWDLRTGKTSTVKAPGRSGYPWTLPVGILAVYVAYRYWTRKKQFYPGQAAMRH